MQSAGGKAAKHIGEYEKRNAKGSFDIVAGNKKEIHIAKEMKNSPVQKHGTDKGKQSFSLHDLIGYHSEARNHIGPEKGRNQQGSINYD